MAKRAQQKRDARVRVQQMRARQRAQERRRLIGWYGGGALVAAVVVVLLVVLSLSKGATNGPEVMPPGVGSGAPVIEPPALVVANTTGIAGVVAYDTTGWPATSHNGPAAEALPHHHVPGPVSYSVTPPVGGDHNAVWMNCGVYTQPVPNERAVHNLEHGAVWITYLPSLPKPEVDRLRALEARQSVIAGSRYVDLSPYPGLPAPIVISSWGFQLRVNSPTDPRLQRFIEKFRASQQYTPEYGGMCTGGVGNPLDK